MHHGYLIWRQFGVFDLLFQQVRYGLKLELLNDVIVEYA